MAAPAADAAGRCWAREPSRVPATAIRPRPGAATGQEACLGEPFGSDVLQAALAHVLAGEHDGQQLRGVARQRRARVGAVIGSNGSGDVVSATRIDGHSSGVPWLRQGRAGRTRAQASPRQEIGSCETGLSWGKLWTVRFTEFPRPRPDVHGPPSPAGFGISRVLGSGGSSRHTANRLWRPGTVTSRLASGEEPIAVSFTPFVLEAAAAEGPPPPRSVLSRERWRRAEGKAAQTAAFDHEQEPALSVSAAQAG